jgi:hypothetical protein
MTVLSAITSRAGLVAIALVVGFLYGYRVASNGEKVRNLRGEVAALRIDLSAANAAAAQAEAEARGLRDLQARLEGELDAYTRELAARPDIGACRLTGDDVRRLRGLR